MEDEALKWLRENDPYYKDMTRNKMNEEYPYLTKTQEKRRKKIEIPFSSLWFMQKVRLRDDGYLDENIDE